MDSRQAALMLAGFIGLVAIIGGVGWLSTHGTTISSGPCRWESASEQYKASVSLKNQQDEYTIVHVMVQWRFHPPKGGQWPYPMLRTVYESTTKELNVTLGPKETRTTPVAFTIPGVKRFLCTAHAKIAGQDRLGQHPGIDVLLDTTR